MRTEASHSVSVIVLRLQAEAGCRCSAKPQPEVLNDLQKLLQEGFLKVNVTFQVFLVFRDFIQTFTKTQTAIRFSSMDFRTVDTVDTESLFVLDARFVQLS